MHEVLVNCLVKLAQEKVWLGELTVLPGPWLLAWDVKQKKTKTKKQIVTMIGGSALSSTNDLF